MKLHFKSMRRHPLWVMTLLLSLNSMVLFAQEEKVEETNLPQPPLKKLTAISNEGNNAAPTQTPSPEELLGCQTPSCLPAESPAEKSENPEDFPFQLFRDGSRLKLSGWVESGLYVNSHGATSKYGPYGAGLLENSGNGPNFGAGLRTTDYNMNQLWTRLIREMNCENGFDWGFRADLLYGMNGYGVQSSGDNSFDTGWGEGDYGLGFHQLYAEMGYKKLTARYGKFGTPIGWEETASWNNFFYSHSYCFNIEPCIHTGALLHYQLTDDLKLAGGWSAGMENGFTNRYGDQSVIAGFEWALTKKSTLYYYMTQGKLKNGLDAEGFDRFESGLDTEYFIQSIDFEWKPTEKWTYVCQYNLNNLNEFGGNQVSAYGINNHLIYKIDDKWSTGLRAEWLRDNGVLAYENASGKSNNSDYVELTLGVDFNPTEHLRIRPEIRYDHAFKNQMFANGTKNEQFSGGFGILYGF